MTDLGDAYLVTVNPSDINGDPIDVATLALSITLPDGTAAGPFTPAHDGLGAYSYPYPTVQAGRHVTRWVGTGYVDTGSFNVWPADPRFMFSLAEARQALRWGADRVAVDDERLRLYVAATTCVIEDIVGPIVNDTRTVVVDGGGSAILLPDLNTTVLSMTVDGTVLVEGTDYTVKADAGIVYAGSQQACGRFTYGVGTITIVYRTGYSAIPPNLVLAGQEELRFLWQIGMQANRPSFGNEPESGEFTPSGFAVPRRVIELCGKDRRAAWTPGHA